ncbi:hypothetical protein LTR56_018633 [Elasticomyces elasticus]|nr:hypothetical protein LTR56_018633 [Elasticomyces elasticus]KAK3635644.1 hypothetical protein LTR22_019071 [Elasticomyces elasticus]KAK4933088.1 hypothetical protein LTR49_000572 [Elasticomyces elasticus]KAK5763987.1 hypothetical protein LTS12_005897 [Elasticomyces elasticus]
MHFSYATNLAELNSSYGKPRDHIRLLRPALDREGQLCCTLAVFRLETAPLYAAFSYSWSAGPPGHVEVAVAEYAEADSYHESIPKGRGPIHGNITLSQDLSNAFRRIHLKTPKWYWCDAICIDQSNSAEKTDQVNMMRFVYLQAEHVCIWLGEDEDDKLSSSAHERSGVSQAKLRSLCELGARAWWSRLWFTEQMEAGFEKAQRSNSTAAVHHIISSEVFGDARKHVGHLEHIRRDFRHRAEIPLRRLLEESVGAHASEPVDKVNGLLGLAPVTTRRDVQAAYDAPPAETFAKACLCIVDEEGSLDILVDQWPRSYGQMYDYDDTSFPSWVPDFAGGVRREPDSILKDVITSSNTSRACGVTLPRIYHKLNQHELKMDAIRVDNVAKICRAEHAQPYLRDTDIAAFEHIATVVWPFVSAHNSASQRRLIWKTLGGEYEQSENINAIHTDEESLVSMLEAIFQRHIGIPVARLPLDELGELYEQGLHWLQSVFKLLDGRVLFRTADGHIGVANPEVQEGDIVIMPFGASLPFLLRPVWDRAAGCKAYALVDGCIVHGIMDGELIDAYEAGEAESESFDLL